jgi:hypothetical protein
LSIDADEIDANELLSVMPTFAAIENVVDDVAAGVDDEVAAIAPNPVNPAKSDEPPD